MEICLMVEGQEDVTWEDWLALAAACEENGVGTMFRSDHYLSVTTGASAARSMPGERSPPLAPSPRSCGWGRWSRQRPSAIPRCWRSWL
jgi:hypothetical protein